MSHAALLKNKVMLADKAVVANKAVIAEHFSAAASNYDRYAHVQKDIARCNLALLNALVANKVPYAVDLGCGSGIHTESVAGMANHCLALDISPGMLTTARAHHQQERSAHDHLISYCAGDADCLPIQTGSIDLLHSSMALQWCHSPKNAVAEIARILNDNGSAQLAIMLDSSLCELKQAWQKLGIAPRVNSFFSERQWLNASQDLFTQHANSNVSITVKHDVRCFTEWHASSLYMLRALKRIGAATKTTNISETPATLTTNKAISKCELANLDKTMQQTQTLDNRDSSRGLPLSYQVLFLTIQKQTYSAGQ